MEATGKGEQEQRCWNTQCNLMFTGLLIVDSPEYGIKRISVGLGMYSINIRTTKNNTFYRVIIMTAADMAPCVALTIFPEYFGINTCRVNAPDERICY